jgi:hypothetical protein
MMMVYQRFGEHCCRYLQGLGGEIGSPYMGLVAGGEWEVHLSLVNLLLYFFA